jgi:hypothetical protein
MRHATLLLGLALLTVGFSGCLATSTDETVEAASADETVEDAGLSPAAVENGADRLPWGLSECEFVMAFVPVPASAVEQRLPDGFSARSPEDVGLPPSLVDAAGVDGDALIGVEFEVCERGVGLDGSPVQNMEHATVWTPVYPAEDIGNAFAIYKFKGAFDHQPSQDLLEKQGIPDLGFSAGFDVLTQRTGGPFEASLTWEDAGTYEMRGGGVTDEYVGHAYSLFECVGYMPIPGTEELGRAHTYFHGTSLYEATGTVSVPDGSILDELGSTEQARAYFLFGIGNYKDSSMTFPPNATR